MSIGSTSTRMVPAATPAFANVVTASSRRARVCSYGLPPEAITARSASAIPRLAVM